MDYKDKYIKYKTKYLELKNMDINNQHGGGKKLKYKKKKNKNKNTLMNNISIFDLEGFQSIIISKDNKIIFEYGNTKYDHGYLASCRKSILAILYGMYPINLNKTLEELNINDKLGLSEIEKTATIKNLLTARSGIYHPASNVGDDKNKPERYSKKPGEYFTYNNWDFNALGTIFEQETGLTIYDALNDLGKKIKFEDYDLEFNKKEYTDSVNKNKDTTLSIHPSYHMFISARDMLKIGYLMLNQGKYGDKQVVPKEWIKEITKLHTTKKERNNKNLGYGYMWWVFDEDIEHPLYKAYMAEGLEGQYIIVIPKSNMVIVTKNYLVIIDLLYYIFNIIVEF
jgi:hypothetical protein